MIYKTDILYLYIILSILKNNKRYLTNILVRYKKVRLIRPKFQYQNYYWALLSTRKNIENE